MLDKHRTMAKEIVDQARNHFRSQQQWPDLAKENAKNPAPEVAPQKVVGYEPSNNFQKIFSEIVGDKGGTGEPKKTESIYEHMAKINYHKAAPQPEPVKPAQHELPKVEEAPHSPVKTKETPNPPVEEKIKPATPSVSVFQRLSQERKEEEATPSPKIDITPEKDIAPEEKVEPAKVEPEKKSSNRASIFKRLSH